MNNAYLAWLRGVLRDVVIYRVGHAAKVACGVSERYVVIGCLLPEEARVALLASLDPVAAFGRRGMSGTEAFPLDRLRIRPLSHRMWNVKATWMHPGELRHVIELMRIGGELPLNKPTIEYRETWPNRPRRWESPIARTLRAWAPFARVRRALAAMVAAWNEGRASEQ